jgi:competence protein ComEC
MRSARTSTAPLAVPVTLWVLGIVLAGHLKPEPLLLAVPAIVLCISAWLLPRWRIYLLLALCLLAGAWRMQIAEGYITPLRELLQQRKQLRQEMVFRLSSVLSYTENRYQIKLYSLAGNKMHDRLLYRSETPLEPGFWYRGLADVQQLNHDPLLDIYPARFSGSAYQLGKLTRLSRTNLSGWTTKLRLSLLKDLDTKLGTNAAWAKGLLLSDSEAKNTHLNSLSNSGMMHLIVVSGLHVWFIYLVVVSLLRIFVPRHIAEWGFLPLIILFAALNNFAPPITRSIVMIGSLILARQLERPLSGLQGLAISLLLITLASPVQLFNIGLQLSYLAVLVILYGLPRIAWFNHDRVMNSPRLYILGNILEGLLLTVLVSLAIIPLTLFYFGRASLNGIIGNILGIPLIGILLPLSLLIMLVPQSWTLFTTLKLVYEYTSLLWTKWVLFSASLPFALSGIYSGQNAAWALVIIILWLFLLIRGKFLWALYGFIPMLGLSALLFLVNPPNHKVTELTVFNSGVADCCLVKLNDGLVLMVDTGGINGYGYAEQTVNPDKLNSGSWAQRKLLPWLSRQNIRQIDALVITHLHSDHCGGFPALAASLKIKHIFVSDESLKQPLWREFEQAGYLSRSKVHVIADTISYRIGQNRLKFLHPDKQYHSDNENNRSLVFRLDASGKRMLFSGDIESEAEKYLAERYDDELQADYLKVPHHGSKSSSSEVFLATVKPREAWLTVSHRNRFRFPHPETVRRYNRDSIDLLSTAEGSFRKVIDTSVK